MISSLPEFHPRFVTRPNSVDLRSPAGVEAATVRMRRRAGHFLRAFIVTGSSGFTAHPVNLLASDGSQFPLSTTRGLIPSFDPHFDWQVDAYNSPLSTKSMVGHALIAWCDTYL